MKDNETFVTRQEFEEFKHKILSSIDTLVNIINADRLSNTRRSKVAQDIIRYELEAIKEHIPSLDHENLKKKHDNRLRRFKDDCRR